MSTVPSVSERLSAYEELTRARMTPYLRPEVGDGYLYPLMREYPSRRGKGLRPALLLATCQAFGGTVRAGLPAAVSLELLHNAFLVHDDVEDDSAQRRGAPTLHARYGGALAVNAGDGLVLTSVEPLLADRAMPRHLVRRVGRELRGAVRHTVEGQALELGWQLDRVVRLDVEDYVRMAAKKTSWYTTVAPLRVGAILGSGGAVGADQLKLLSRLGFHLGVAFQLRDDLLDLDEDAQTGKTPMTDVVEGKRTLMMLHLLQVASAADRAEAEAILRLARPERTPQVARRLVELYERYDSTTYVRQVAAVMEGEAARLHEQAFAGVPCPDHAQFVGELAEYLSVRGL